MEPSDLLERKAMESEQPLQRTKSASSVRTEPDDEKRQGWIKSASDPFNPSTPVSSNDGATKPTKEPGDYLRLARPRTLTLLGGRIKLRARDDDDPTDWWFASTAIPLLAATFAPMANLLSIAALVVSWRSDIMTPDDPSNVYALSKGRPDPGWCLKLNGASLACGFVGNIFLLCNFTKKIRYIIALPLTIFLFYIASSVLIGITAGMTIYDPIKDGQVYSQGFWHAIIAACLYMGLAMLLMVNMLGYFLGHYPQHFDLNDEQRNLVLQTMIFFIWLGGGSAVFTRLERARFPGGFSDALYFSVVTLLTIGFGDFYATDDVGRGLVFPYTVGGTIILGLMVSSIHKFAQELSKEKVIKQHIETRRVATLKRAVPFDLAHPAQGHGLSATRKIISRPLEGHQIQEDLDMKGRGNNNKGQTIEFQLPQKQDNLVNENEPSASQFRFQQDLKARTSTRSLTLEKIVSLRHRLPALIPTKAQKAILMKSEKDRFDKMRDIQAAAKNFKKWYALIMSIISFGLLWCVGAVVFWIAEADTQGLSYFQALYFAYVSLLTIGYGDLSPRSNAGKAFFVFWALVAVPTMTILVSDLGDTAIGGFKRKVLEYGGLAFLGKGRGWGLDWFMDKKEDFQRRMSIVGVTHRRSSVAEPRPMEASEEGQSPRHWGNIDDADEEYERRRPPKTIDELANEHFSQEEMTRRLGHAMQRVADDMKKQSDKRYTYEEWVEFTRLVRFSRFRQAREGETEAEQQLEYDEAVDGLIEWDWLDSNSPMTSEQSEPEWVMDRLLESLLRSFKNGLNLPRLPLPENKEQDTGDKQINSSHQDNMLQYGRRASSADASEEQPQWSRRGKARLQTEAPSARFRPASGFHGRMNGVL